VHVTPTKRRNDLEIEHDMRFQRREWRAQRIGRFALLGVIIMALAGVFGSGPLSSVTRRTADGLLEVHYHRIARHGSPEPLRIRITPVVATDSVVDIWISQEYLHGLAVRWISPDPVDVAAGNDRLTYRFQLLKGSRVADLIFQVDADRLWMRRGAIGRVGGDSIRFRQFVFP
jgi:hypothetical protein